MSGKHGSGKDSDTGKSNIDKTGKTGTHHGGWLSGSSKGGGGKGGCKGGGK